MINPKEDKFAAADAAKKDAVERAQTVHSRWETVNSITDKLRILREQNGFAELMREAFRGK